MKFFASLMLSLLIIFSANAQPRKPRTSPPQPATENSAIRTPNPITSAQARHHLFQRRSLFRAARNSHRKSRNQFSFKQSQVDDVLKSLVVLDLGKGRIGAVSYNSSAPPSARSERNSVFDCRRRAMAELRRISRQFYINCKEPK